jgi:dTDP-glucose 4,6-dehydratase
VVEVICSLMDELRPQAAPHARLITQVTDHPGHYGRYVIDAAKITAERSWRPRHSFEEGLQVKVRWCVENQSWCGLLKCGNSRAGSKG